jgi:hypothetical protein
LTAPICGLFWKTSSFLIHSPFGGIEFQLAGNGLSKKRGPP